jgi:hypothetical protein
MCPPKSSCPKCQEKPPYYEKIEEILKFLFKHLGIILGIGLVALLGMVVISFMTGIFGRQFGGFTTFFVPPPMTKYLGFLSLHHFTVASANRLKTSVEKIVNKFLTDINNVSDEIKKDVAITNFKLKAPGMIKPGLMPVLDFSFGKDPITPQLDAARAIINQKVV